jgi:hypothetical protein
MKQVISLVKKNYRLENLDEGLEAQDKTGEVGTILRLNQAGRRYLITDAGSIAKGVEVLVAVRDDLGCLFYHLLQNPLLCDLEKMAAFRSSASSPRNFTVRKTDNITVYKSTVTFLRSDDHDSSRFSVEGNMKGESRR